MNRKPLALTIATLLIFLNSFTAGAQIDSSGIDVILLNNRTFNNPNDTAVQRKLVELALASPKFRLATHEVKISELELRKTKGNWLNFLTLSLNYNEFSSQKSTGTGTQPPMIYPRYFFALNVPLGIIFSQGPQTKMAREAVAQGNTKKEDLGRSIKLNILSKYNNYKALGALMEIQSEMTNDIAVSAAQAEEDFKRGIIKFDTYLTTRKSANEELTKNVNMKLEQELLKLEIEEIIGVPLESVLNPANSSQKSTKK
ncbi:TolC family protein [Terrimonas sp. NA20]|uniref:TolC family protein n=1 Tax=Terrimonas ginsenosidimutans TaxID=2908004 RepID=A0ABS9KX02_9BACT|nr:TolC family protein [Terrimonas ginsenosidimutans]MCG2616856.1 TolC family protein [Terrimonas ginsenosidimutans]